MTSTTEGRNDNNLFRRVHSIVWSDLPALLPAVPIIAISGSLLGATNLVASVIFPMIAVTFIMAGLGWAFGIVLQASKEASLNFSGAIVGWRQHLHTSAKAGFFGLAVGGIMSCIAFAQVAMNNGAPVEVLMAGRIGGGVLLVLALLVLPAALLRSAETDSKRLSFYELAGNLSRSPRILFHGTCVTAAFICSGVVLGPIVMGGAVPLIAALYVVALEPLRQSHRIHFETRREFQLKKEGRNNV
jgi:hypothetical protein